MGSDPLAGELPVVGQPAALRADAARNRERILDAARAVLNEHGADRLTMNEVAARAGLGVGTVYRRFSDQAGLVDAVMNDRETALQRQILSGPPPLGPGAPPVLRIRAFLEAYVDLLEVYAPVLATVRDNQRLRRRARGGYAVHHQHLTLLIEQARPDADAAFLADALLVGVDAGRFLVQRRDLGYSVQQIKDGLNQLVTGFGDR